MVQGFLQTIKSTLLPEVVFTRIVAKYNGHTETVIVHK